MVFLLVCFFILLVFGDFLNENEIKDHGDMNVNGVFKYSQREHKSLALCNSFYTEWFTPPKGYPLVTVRTNEIHNS